MADKPSLALPRSESQQELAQQWRHLARMATLVAILTSPAIFLWLRKFEGWSIGWSIFATFVAVAAFRGFIDIVLRRMIPWPSLFGTDDPRLREEDVVNRRRAWFRRVVSLWQSGELFEEAGGKRERGLLFLGAPGTGKTMLAKAIATGFNSPFISIPGSGFAQTFIGIDAVIVRYLARKAKKMASKWGGQCIVFIDEIDAVGMRRSALGGARMTGPSLEFEDYCFFGENGALTPTGDLVLETRAWRDRLFAQRAEPRTSPYPEWTRKLGAIVNQAFPGGLMGGGGELARNQLLVTMDGIDNPPLFRRAFVNRMHT